MIVETAIVNAEDGIEKWQCLNLQLELGGSYVYQTQFTVRDRKGFDSVFGKGLMHDVNCRYEIDLDSKNMCVADNL